MTQTAWLDRGKTKKALQKYGVTTSYEIASALKVDYATFARSTTPKRTSSSHVLIGLAKLGIDVRALLTTDETA